MKSRAFVLADAVMGIAILSVLTVIVAVEVWSRVAADQRLETQRAAVAQAELVLSQLYAGQSAGIPDTSKAFRLEHPSGGAHVPGYSWVRVVVSQNGQTISMIGLERTKAGGDK